MASREEDTSSEDSEGSSTGSSSEDFLQAYSEAATSSDQDQEPSTSSSRPVLRRKARAQSSARPAGPPATLSGTEAHGSPSAEASAASGGPPKLPMPKLDLRALFDYLSRKKQLSKSRRRLRAETATERKSPEPRAKRPRLKASKKRRERRRERILQFPFVEKLYGRKHLPLRMECLFQQEAYQGFFKYIEKLKFEQHLKDSLAQLDATDDLERESLEARSHKYLDDDGPLSPIEEPNGGDMDEGHDPEDIGARIVENSFFILSSHIPEKKKSKGKTKS
ncbi:TATA box-binding protein-associated factor RNA polymerase I subunit D [Paroedura picta]|uniref:TATA box-binding protein-associated factor RNA polymerase I subunit D n=1 Tax=Paroedura picta TaxID=143630 RepID=UPI0040574972